MSRIMWITDSNAISVEAMKFIDNTNPVITCSIRVIPSRNPKFHRNEMANGVGTFKRESSTILTSGSLCEISYFFILL